MSGYIYEPNDTCDVTRIDILKAEGFRFGNMTEKKDVNSLPHALNLIMSSRVFISTQQFLQIYAIATDKTFDEACKAKKQRTIKVQGKKCLVMDHQYLFYKFVMVVEDTTS